MLLVDDMMRGQIMQAVPQRNIVRPDLLEAWWVGDECLAASWPDRSGKGRTLTGAANINVHSLNGRKVPGFNSPAGVRMIVAAFTRGLAAFTITGLARCDVSNTSVSGYDSFIGEGPSNSPWPDWAIMFEGNPTTRITYSHAQGTAPPNQGFPARFGEWTSYTLAYSGGFATQYANGVMLGRGSFAYYGGSWNGNMGVGWNQYPFDSRGLVGAVAEISIHNVDLGQAGVEAMWRYQQSEWGLAQAS